jgi:ankyrin repeat protein
MLIRRAFLLLVLSMLFFGAGIATADVAKWAVTLIAPEPVTLLDALAEGNDEAMFRMTSEGSDPGLPDILKFSVLHWDRGEKTSPLLVAIGGGDMNIVAYLTKHTTRLREFPNDQALCVAARYGHTNIARYLMARGVPAVPKSGCGTLNRPEDVAKKFGNHSLAKALRSYRLRGQASID